MLSVHQFGFRIQRSTEQAISFLVDNIQRALDSSRYFLGLFLDLSKAFDTVNHEILLKKLEHYGVRGPVLKWIEHYLKDRYQYVEYNNFKSGKSVITCGVPQGSILGPLLFILYVNDLPSVSSILSTVMFADDTSMFLAHDDLKHLEYIVNIELAKVVEWLNVNKLSINVGKTHAMLFTNRNINSLPPIHISIQHTDVQFVSKISFIGILIDNKLSWRDHILKISNKIAKGIGIIRKVRHKLQRSTLINLYYCFVFPYLHYCIVIWGNASNLYVNPLLYLQKRILRIIYDVHFKSSAKPLFIKSKILNVFDLYVYCVLIFMFKHWRSLLPECLNDVLKIKVVNVSILALPTRSQNFYEIKFFRTTKCQKSLSYVGPSLFNILMRAEVVAVSEIHTVNCFKSFLKRNILHVMQLCNGDRQAYR